MLRHIILLLKIRFTKNSGRAENLFQEPIKTECLRECNNEINFKIFNLEGTASATSARGDTTIPSAAVRIKKNRKPVGYINDLVLIDDELLIIQKKG